MKNIKNIFPQLPYLLTYSRLVIALYFILLAVCKPLQNPLSVAVFLIVAVLTDIFDGVLARKFKIYSVKLRKLDSRVDTLLWFTLLLVVMAIFPAFIKEHMVQIMWLVAAEIFVQLLGYFKFSTSNALHTYAAKAWMIMLTLTIILLCAGESARIIFNVTFVWGLLVQLEAAIIILRLKAYRVDVKSMFHI
jgi:phosphatidylglycerophosphate synthase